MAAPFESLDFVYMPSRDPAGDLEYFERVLGARVVFAIDDGGTRVAMLQLTDGGPPVLLANHLDGTTPILVYRVPTLQGAMLELESRGWERGVTLELPHGPGCSFRTPGGHRIAIYELARPFMDGHFAGRRDF